MLSITEGGADESNITATEEPEPKDLSTCGANYCPVVPKSSNDTSGSDDNFSASKNQLYILAGVFLACSISSALIVAKFVDPLSK